MGDDLLPLMLMVIITVGDAAMNILSKLAMDSGMNPLVHVAYRQFFATAIMAPFAYLERRSRPKMTRAVLFQIFLCSIFGATLYQVLYFVGLDHSTPTIACALSNLEPVLTFLLAIPFGLESLGIKKKAGQAKVLGTVVCVGGAMLLSFYHGSVVIGGSSIHWKYADKMEKGNSSNTTHDNFILGPFLLLASTMSWGAWLVIQAKMGLNYSAPCTSSALICLMASIECGIIGIIAVRDLSAWSLRPTIRVVATLYGVQSSAPSITSLVRFFIMPAAVCTALAFCLIAWCLKRKGPLYVSVFSPLLLVVAAILSWILLQEKLYVGTVVGSAMIVMGLYTVLWGKKKEMKGISNAGDEGEEETDAKGNHEMQCTELPNGNLRTKSLAKKWDCNLVFLDKMVSLLRGKI